MGNQVSLAVRAICAAPRFRIEMAPGIRGAVRAIIAGRKGERSELDGVMRFPLKLATAPPRCSTDARPSSHESLPIQ